MGGLREGYPFSLFWGGIILHHKINQDNGIQFMSYTCKLFCSWAANFITLSSASWWSSTSREVNVTPIFCSVFSNVDSNSGPSGSAWTNSQHSLKNHKYYKNEGRFHDTKNIKRIYALCLTLKISMLRTALMFQNLSCIVLFYCNIF